MDETTARPLPGVFDRATLTTLSGLELMRGIAEGRFPQPAIGGTVGFRLALAEPGRAVFEAEPDQRHYNMLGSVHGGIAATLLDSCMSCAVHTTLPAGTGYTTLELKLNYIRPMTIATGLVRAEGRALHTGRRSATAEGDIRDGAGKLIAHGTVTCFVFRFDDPA